MIEEEQSQGRIRKQQKPFIMSPTHICRNNQISSVAYKLWNVIESKPEGWEFFWYEILGHFLEGRNKVKKSLKELETFGFVKKTRRKKGNLYCGMDLELFYDPTLPLTQENQGSLRLTENGSIENGSNEDRSTENSESEIGLTENRDINKDINKSKRVSKNNLSLKEVEDFWKKLREREKYNFDFDCKKFFDWCIDENDLKISWKNILKSWVENPKNQIKIEQKSSPDTEEQKKQQILHEEQRLASITKFSDWQNVINDLKQNFSENIYNQWLSKIELHSFSEQEIILSAPSKFLRDWIRREYIENNSAKTANIREICAKYIPNLKKISIIHQENI